MRGNLIPLQTASHHGREMATLHNKCPVRLRKLVNYGLASVRIFMRVLYGGGRSHLVSYGRPDVGQRDSDIGNYGACSQA